MKTKQVIVMRKDLKMNRGKEIAQGAHAAMAWLTRNIKSTQFKDTENFELHFDCLFSEAEKHWLENSFTKVCLQCNSEDELFQIYLMAMQANLEAHLIQDNGDTYFQGVKTYTCLAIGPDESYKIDEITKHLKLY